MRIVIVGGGTAGWLTAILGLALAPEHSYTVVESSRLGIIGVGESTTGFFTDLFNNDLKHMGVDHNEFIIKTGATPKLGIRHRAWRPDLNHSYLGPLDGSNSQFESRDTQFEYALHNLSPEDRITISHTGYLLRHGLSNMNRSNEFTRYGHALHVDGTLTGRYFRDACLKKPNCQLVDSELADLARDEQGMITSLTLTSGQRLEGDLFIDCTGFNRELISRMGAKWVSYRQWLPVDRGMPFLEQYQADEAPEAWTTAWAQKNGWMWTTPLMDRKGNGYVYSSAHTTDDQAQQDIEEQLGRAITPVKIVKFDAGRQDRAWIGNCVSIGLSSSFLEPLEATSIHTTICQIKMLFSEYLGDSPGSTLVPSIAAAYNRRWQQQIDDLKDFLVMHYQGGRQDTEFWRMITNGDCVTDRVSELKSMSQHRLPNFNDFPRYWGTAGWSLYSWVMAGVGLFDHVKPRWALDPFDSEIDYDLEQQQLARNYSQNLTHDEMISWFRQLRAR